MSKRLASLALLFTFGGIGESFVIPSKLITSSITTTTTNYKHDERCSSTNNNRNEVYRHRPLTFMTVEPGNNNLAATADSTTTTSQQSSTTTTTTEEEEEWSQEEMNQVRTELIAKYVQFGKDQQDAENEVDKFLSDPVQSKQYLDMRRYAKAQADEFGGAGLYFQLGGAFFLGLCFSVLPKYINSYKAMYPDGGGPIPFL